MVLVIVCAACADESPEMSSGDGVVADAAVVLASSSLGPVQVEVRTDAVSPRFGDRFHLLVEITHGSAARLEPVEFTDRIGHLRKVGRRDPPRGGAGSVVYGLLVEPERTGTNIGTLPPIVFQVLEGEGAGTVRSLRVPPFELEVAGLPADEKPKLADVGGPLPPVPLAPTDRGLLTLWVAIGGCALLLGLTLMIWWQRRRRVDVAPPPIDPVAEARRALQDLLARGLIEAGAFGVFYVELTGIVRLFIERTTGVQAPDRTTEEFLRESEAHGAFPADKRGSLRRFLEAADLVKYAALIPGPGEVSEAVDAAFAFCESRAEQATACAAQP